MQITITQLRKLVIFFTGMSVAGCSTLYFMIQQAFSKKEYYTEAIKKLESLPSVLRIIGAPPLKVHYLKLGDRYNHVNLSTAKIKIPVSGSCLRGDLCTFAVRDPKNERWDIQEVILELENGEKIKIFPSNADQEETSPNELLMD